MRKIICIALMFALMVTNSMAQEVESSVTINGQYLKSDTHHLLVDDTVFVVGRSLVEALEGEISWVSETQTVIIELGDKVIELRIGDTQAVVSGNPMTLVKAPFIRDGRTMIPLRFVSEVFNCNVLWHVDTYTVEVTKDGLILDEDFVMVPTYTDEDLFVLAKIVTVESGDGSMEMKLAIANTVLNRVKDSRFPNTVAEVIYQIDRYVQFPPAHKDSFATLEPDQLAIAAAKKALEGVNPIGYSLYFNNAPFKSKPNDLIRVIEGEYFYR